MRLVNPDDNYMAPAWLFSFFWGIQMTVRRLLDQVLRFVVVGCVLLFSSQLWADSNKDFNTRQNTLVPLYLWGVSMSGTSTFGTSTVLLDRVQGCGVESIGDIHQLLITNRR